MTAIDHKLVVNQMYHDKLTKRKSLRCECYTLEDEFSE